MPAGSISPGGGWASGARDAVDIQPRDRDPCDLARRAANVSELISASPAELTPWNQGEKTEMVICLTSAVEAVLYVAEVTAKDRIKALRCFISRKCPCWSSL